MTTTDVLVDTSYLVALADPGDKRSREAVRWAATQTNRRIVPDIVLPEVAHMLQRFISHKAMRTFIQTFAASDAQLVPIDFDDLKRAHEIMTTYADARFDLVDCCVMALAEKLDITSVLTFDRRHFSIFRPKHCVYLELLP